MIFVHLAQFILGFMSAHLAFSVIVPDLPKRIFQPELRLNKSYTPSAPMDSKGTIPLQLAAAVYIPCLIGGISRKRMDKVGRQTYVLWYDFNGQRHNIYTDKDGKAWTSREAAEDLLNTIRYEIKTNSHDPEKYRPENKNRYSLSNVVSSYLESRKQDVIHNRLGKHQLHEITNHIEKQFLLFMRDNEQIKDIRAVKLYHLERLNNSGLPVWNAKTVKNFWTSIDTFLNWCVRMQLIQHPGHPNLPEVVGKPIKWLTDEEQEKVLAKIPDRHKPIFHFLCYYGCRPSEATALQVQDVQGNMVVVQRAFNRSGELDTTKTGKNRVLPIIEETAPLIKAALSGKIGGQTPLFINPDTGSFYNYQALRWQWDVVRKELGIDRTLTEGTRKTVATSAINAGETPANIAGMLGNSPEVLKRHYAQVQAPLFAGVVKRRSFQTVSKTKSEG